MRAPKEAMRGAKVKETPMKKTVLGAVTMCAGAPLLALGVGTATAWADTTEPSTDPSTTQQSNDGSLAISVGGITVVQTGNSTAETWGPNLAIAYNNSHAQAFGIGSLAIATNNSYAGTGAGGFLNTAIADNNSDAVAGWGFPSSGNTSIARDGSYANSGGNFGSGGNFNRVTATNNSSASANGNFNTVTANDGSTADISGDTNTVTARCGGSVVFSAQSNKIVTNAPCDAG
jgi:hypothetical protein